MEEKITSDQLHVTCRFPFINIKECRIYAICGTHTTADITGMVNAGEAGEGFNG